MINFGKRTTEQKRREEAHLDRRDSSGDGANRITVRGIDKVRQWVAGVLQDDATAWNEVRNSN